jgi:hypothetical protein
MQNKGTLLTELDWLTDKISSQVWTLNIGTLGTTWSLLIAESTIPDNLRLSKTSALPIIILCVLAMTSELVQYLVAYANSRFLLHALEKSGRMEFEYDRTALLYRLRGWCFYGKIALTLCAAAWLLITLLRKLA